MNGPFTRRTFLSMASALLLPVKLPGVVSIQTVNGAIPIHQMGKTLIHEHFLVDFIGADKIDPSRWDNNDVVKKILPLLLEAREQGVKTILDCTPSYLGRDIELLKILSQRSALHIITNTGYYGAAGNKYLPSYAYTESEIELASRWIREFEESIEGTGVKPGFIKIGVDGNELSPLHQKLVRAAALAHLKTGLTICSHTGIAALALEEIDLLKQMKVDPSAFVWVHAQAEKNRDLHVKAARMGAWVSLDGLGWGETENYADSIHYLKQHKLLDRVLISHDAGWYKPGEPDGGSIKGYTDIFTRLIPILKKKGFKDAEFNQLLVKNPAHAFGIKLRSI